MIIKSMKMFTSSIQGPRPLGLGLVVNGSGDADDDNNDDIVNMRRKRERCSDLPSKAQGRRALAQLGPPFGSGPRFQRLIGADYVDQ